MRRNNYRWFLLNIHSVNAAFESAILCYILCLQCPQSKVLLQGMSVVDIVTCIMVKRLYSVYLTSLVYDIICYIAIVLRFKGKISHAINDMMHVYFCISMSQAVNVYGEITGVLKNELDKHFIFLFYKITKKFLTVYRFIIFYATRDYILRYLD
jgi:hypothetical protein